MNRLMTIRTSALFAANQTTKNTIQLMRTLSVMSVIVGQSLNQILQRNTGTIQYLSTGSAVSGGTRWVAVFYA